MNFDQYVSTEKLMIHNIPCLYAKPRIENPNFHTIVLYHGWVSRKENILLIANLLCLTGYHVLIPDAFMHGDREGKLDYSAEVRHRHFWDVVIRTVDEARLLIDSLIEQGLAIDGKIAVMGDSMGGTIATGVFTHNPDIKALVNINGCSSWEYLERYTQKTERKITSEEEQSRIRNYDPINYIESMVPRPILLIHGTADTILPIECQRDFMSKAQEFYQVDEAKLQLREIPRMNHYISMGMIETAIEWLLSNEERP